MKPDFSPANSRGIGGRLAFGVATGLLALALNAPLRAEFIQPMAVLVSNGEASQDALIDGQGFDDPGVGTPASIHSRLAADMWSGVGSIRESAILDLGKTVGLTKVYLWNYNVADATDVGMKDVEVQVSSDTLMTNAAFNAIARIALQEGGQTSQVFNVVGTGVRLVKLKGLSNWGQGYTVGLAEVRFESGDITGNVPKVVVNSPHEGDEIAFGSSITFDTKVTDADADLLQVEYFDGDTLVTNRTVSPYAVTLATPPKGEHAYRVVATDKSGKVAWVTVNLTVRELVADRIIKLDDTADEGTGLNQISYVTGTWNLAQGTASDPRYNNNDHYNLGTTKTDYFELRFQGVKVDLFATVASHHGSGMASIDGGPESKVIYKAAQRKEQVFVWGSPILANREHVLRVRTVGDGVVTADRFDVSVSDKPDLAQAIIKTVTFTQVVVTMEDVGTSVVVPTSITVSLDGVSLARTSVKSGAITTITCSPASPFAPGSNHTLKVQGQDAAGHALSSDLAFNLPAPFFPLTGLGGPAGTAGNWGVRQIWNAGRADAVVSAAAIALQATQPGFAGSLQDSSAPVINFALTSNPGAGGLFPDDQPLPAETAGLTASDFVIVTRALVKIPRSGDWTIGVHSDEGFALRFVGHPFDSVNGNGVRDDDFPEYIGYLTETANSNTRGILNGLAAGNYEIEFLGFQRAGGAFCEIYAAEGAFDDDSGTVDWQLIGAPGGLEIVAAPVQFEIRTLSLTAGQLSLEFQSPKPDGSHQLLESTDLRTWQPAAGATYVQTGNNGVRVSVSGVTGSVKFFRLSLPTGAP
jgi:hypothetical protein